MISKNVIGVLLLPLVGTTIQPECVTIYPIDTKIALGLSHC